MKTLKFRGHQKRLILNGTKTVTWRLFDEKGLQAGDTVQLIDWEANEVFAEVMVVGVREKRLGEISEHDFLGHERFQDTAEMLNHYRSFYGDQVTMETPIKMVEFKLIRPALPENAQS